MKRSIWIFLLAVFVPSIVLGWLSLRSAEEQQIILERRTSALYQKEADALAASARALIEDERRSFAEAVGRLAAQEPPADLARNFTTRLQTAWPRKAVGFALGKDGTLLSPAAQGARSHPEWQRFLLNNGAFLSSRAAAQVYWVSGEELSRTDPMRRLKGGYDNVIQKAIEPAAAEPYPAPAPIAGNLARETSKAAPAPQKLAAAPASKAMPFGGTSASSAPLRAKSLEKLPKDAPAPGKAARSEVAVTRDAAPDSPATPASDLPRPSSRASSQLAPELEAVPAAPAAPMLAPTGSATTGLMPSAPINEKQEASLRNVAPQRLPDEYGQALSQVVPATTEFNRLTASGTEGVVTRFVQDQLEIVFWLRPAAAPDLIFGCMVEAASLQPQWANALPAPPPARSPAPAPEYVLALLDDHARPAATQPPGETGRDWKRPFVAAEIGEILPHWEAALYLQRPEQLQESARSLRRTLQLLIASALAVMACGGWLVVADARRQLALAQQKSDFVSNVSHELKTPLTSIRMFAELLQGTDGAAHPKHAQYLRIIMVEAERLTRLINNVLDFASLGRKRKVCERRLLDFHAVIARTWEGLALHLEDEGFTTSWEAQPGPYPVLGDADALAQILVNLLANAEKYSGERKEVELRSGQENGCAWVTVLDRGLGVPAGEERKIFEAFYRAHDSLSSGIQGSGLGLTLAQRLAVEHDGSIHYRAREHGGSAFTFRLPLAADAAAGL